MRLAFCALIAAILCLAGDVHARTVRVEDDEGLRRALSQLRPGTTIEIAPGTYRGGLSVTGARGTKSKPIVLAGADPEKPPRIEGGGSGLHLSGAAFLEVRDLVLVKATGNGLNIDDGGEIDDPAHHITVRRVVVREVGPRGNHDGIKLSGVDDFLVADCQLIRWGDGGSGVDMVGCHRGTIERSLFRHTAAASGSGVQMKGGSSAITVRGCRFEHAGGRAVNLGGSTGRPYFRPRDPGYEAKDLVVEDCAFIGSGAPVAFVGVDGAVVRGNTFYRPSIWVLRILQESTGEDFVPCRNGRFTRNLIVFRSTEIRTHVNVGSGTSPETFAIAENFWFAEDDPRASRPKLPVPEKNGVHGEDPRLTAPEQGDLRQKPGSKASGFGATTELVLRPWPAED